MPKKKNKKEDLNQQAKASPQQSSSIPELTSATFSGPIPPPSVLDGYENICPGAAERIIAMAEREAEHSHLMDKEAMQNKSDEVKRGQTFALVVTLAAFAAACVCAYVGAEKAAVTIGGTTVVGLVTAFIVGRKTSS